MRGFQGTPAQTGKEGLFRLVEQAQVSYKEEVATRQKSYRRYVLDFIHSKRFHDATDAWSKNEHQKNYHTVVDLLKNHEKLVRRYFDQETFDGIGVSMLLDDFYTADLQNAITPIEPDQTSSGISVLSLSLIRKWDHKTSERILRHRPVGIRYRVRQQQSGESYSDQSEYQLQTFT